jgi:hypothetical protein
MKNLAFFLFIWSSLWMLPACDNNEPDQPLGELIVDIDGQTFRSTSIEATMVISANVNAKTFTLTASEGDRQITLILQELGADITDACLPIASFTNTGQNRTAGLDYIVDGQKQGILQELTVNVTACNTFQNRADANFTARVQTPTGEINFTNGRFVNVLFQVQQ